MKTWWYGPNKLPHGDGRKVAPGATLQVDGEIVLCKNGLHQSVKPLDALRYGKGYFWRCEPGGVIVHGDDKLASSERTHLWRVADTDVVLRHFARLCALDVIDTWDAPDVVVRYLRTGEGSLRAAAWDAAGAAARDVSWEDGGVAAWEASRAAAWEDAGTAAWEVAWEASRAASRNVGGAAAWAAQNKRLHRMLMKAERVEK